MRLALVRHHQHQHPYPCLDVGPLVSRSIEPPERQKLVLRFKSGWGPGIYCIFSYLFSSILNFTGSISRLCSLVSDR